jgi:tRNA pseudouridine55 synthase
MATDFRNGALLCIDKPYEWTSFDVVNKLRHRLKKKYGVKRLKVGHAGTLDPLATGLLLICTGKWTKKIEEFQAQEKEYTGTLQLGATTPSFDLETPIDSTATTDHLNEKQITEAAATFVGEIDQTPPTYSAVKIDGKRAYEYARKGIETTVKSKKVQISAFEVVKWYDDQIDFRIVCSKGTYIRSIARDLGELLGCGAHLTALRRTRIGTKDIKEAMTVEEAIAFIDRND